MLSSMLYFIVVALLFSAAALSAERVARLTRRSGGWIWAVALVASVLIPAAMSSVSIQLPEAAIGGAAPHAVVLREATSVHLPAAAWGTIQSIAPPASLEIDSLVRRGWIIASIVLLAGLAASGALLLLRQRRWVRSIVAGASVRVAPDAGAAGLLERGRPLDGFLAADGADVNLATTDSFVQSRPLGGGTAREPLTRRGRNGRARRQTRRLATARNGSRTMHRKYGKAS